MMGNGGGMCQLLVVGGGRGGGVEIGDGYYRGGGLRPRHAGQSTGAYVINQTGAYVINQRALHWPSLGVCDRSARQLTRDTGLRGPIISFRDCTVLSIYPCTRESPVQLLSLARILFFSLSEVGRDAISECSSRVLCNS